MPQNGESDPKRDDCEAFLSDVTFDLMPSESFEEALGHLPSGARVAVVLTPELGIDQTIECTQVAIDHGYEVIPHIAARFIEDREELDEIALRLLGMGVTDIFVPGGDRAEPVGAFSSSYELLVTLEDLDHTFPDIGISGYPTGHKSIDDEVLEEAMRRKVPHATYIVTQMCFSATAILEWTLSVRERGIDLPVEPGIPGVMDYWRLMTLSREWGVATPLRFVRKTSGVFGFFRQLIRSAGHYSPDDMVATLAPYHKDPRYDFLRLRLYTFNQTGDTETWRRERLAT